MKKIINLLENIVDEMLEGMVAAHPEYVERVPGFKVLRRAGGASKRLLL